MICSIRGCARPAKWRGLCRPDLAELIMDILDADGCLSRVLGSRHDSAALRVLGV